MLSVHISVEMVSVLLYTEGKISRVYYDTEPPIYVRRGSPMFVIGSVVPQPYAHPTALFFYDEYRSDTDL
jgi:hypothetical protein